MLLFIHLLFLRFIPSFFIFLFFHIFLFIYILGHCGRRSLHVSFSRWQEWRKKLLISRATVDCKMLNLSDLRDECKKSVCVTNSDNCSTIDGQHGDEEDVKCPQSKKRFISSIFISSSSSPLLAVYYLRYDFYPSFSIFILSILHI